MRTALGSDEPLHGGQRSGHNGNLIHGAKSQIRICVLAYSIRHAARGRADRPIGTASRRGRGEGTRCDEAHPGGDRHANQPQPTALREVRHPQPPLTAPLRRKHTRAARRPPGRTAERLKSRSLARRCRAIRYPITLRISNLSAIGE